MVEFSDFKINFHMREIHLSLAGHPKPWLINTDGTAEQIGKYGLILGQFEISHESDNRYEDTTITLNGGYETHKFVPGRKLIDFLEEQKFRIGEPQKCTSLNTNIKPNDRATNKNGVRTINDLSESYEFITNKLLDNGWPQKNISRVKIALDEIIVNAILHGNLCSDSYIVTVSHILHRDILEVCVTDEGIGFGSFNIAQGFTEEDLLKESGRGLFMASKHASKIYFNETGKKCWTIFMKS